MISVAVGLLLLQSPSAETSRWLEKLRAPAAADRAGTQQWLARHLAASDLDAVRAAARAGDAETRRRLELALADDDAHLGLAVSLAADGDALVAGVGRGAISERLARWCPAWSRKGLSRAAVIHKLAGKNDRTIAIDPRTVDRRLDVALDQLARFGPGAPPLVLDPDLALSDHPRDSLRDPAGVLEGPFARVLDELVRLHRSDLEGFALAGDSDASDEPDSSLDPGEPARPWIRVRRVVGADVRSGTDRIIDWCLEVARPADAPADASRKPDALRRSACARAIAGTGWNGGIAWLEERAFVAKDECALDGVLLAAGRGQVAPSLARPEVLRELLARLAGTKADDIARAVAAVGPFGPKDEDLAAIVAQDLAQLPPREQWLRLVALEGMRSPSRAAAAAVASILAAPGVPPPVRFQALRAGAAMRLASGDSLAVADPSGLLAWADAGHVTGECIGLLVALAVRPPPERSEPKFNADRSESLRLAELEWRFFAGDGSAAAGQLIDGGLALEAVAARTRAWVRRGAVWRFDAAIAAAGSLPGATAERLERLQILSVAATAEVRARWITRLSSAPAGREDLLCLAAMASTSEGADARAALLKPLASGAQLADVAAALELAMDCLGASRSDEEERAFVKAVSDAARAGPKEVRSRFQPDAWPPRPQPDSIRAADRDRSLDRSGL